MACMIGVDIGGTFADFVALDTDTGDIRTLKMLTTPATPGAEALPTTDDDAPAT